MAARAFERLRLVGCFLDGVSGMPSLYDKIEAQPVGLTACEITRDAVKSTWFHQKTLCIRMMRGVKAVKPVGCTFYC